MSEQQLKDFAEIAERRVPVPDLADLTSRGRDLRRVRIAGAVGALALVLVAVGGVLSSVSRDDRIERPAEDPKPGVARELDARPIEVDPDLQPGRRYEVRPWSVDGRPVRVEFEMPGSDWVWRGDGATKPLRPEAGLFPIPREPYAAVTTMTADRVLLRDQCNPLATWTELDQEPRRGARQVARIAGTRLEEAPTSTELAGHPAVRLGLSVPRLCPESRDVVLWSLGSSHNGGDNGVGTVFYAGQQLEVWLVDVEGTMLIVYSELSPGLPKRYRDETDALIESIVLEPLEE